MTAIRFEEELLFVDSRDIRFYKYKDPKGRWRITAGCRDFSLKEAREHWLSAYYSGPKTTAQFFEIAVEGLVDDELYDLKLTEEELMGVYQVTYLVSGCPNTTYRQVFDNIQQRIENQYPKIGEWDCTSDFCVIKGNLEATKMEK